MTADGTAYLIDPAQWAGLLKQWHDDRDRATEGDWLSEPFRISVMPRLPACPVCGRVPEQITADHESRHVMDGGPGVAEFEPCGHRIQVPDHGPVPALFDLHVGCDWDDQGRHVADRYRRRDGTVCTTVPQPLPEGADLATGTHYPGFNEGQSA